MAVCRQFRINSIAWLQLLCTCANGLALQRPDPWQQDRDLLAVQRQQPHSPLAAASLELEQRMLAPLAPSLLLLDQPRSASSARAEPGRSLWPGAEPAGPLASSLAEPSPATAVSLPLSPSRALPRSLAPSTPWLQADSRAMNWPEAGEGVLGPSILKPTRREQSGSTTITGGAPGAAWSPPAALAPPCVPSG